ncbi:DUF6522 family protein [Marivita sp. GX14005]|uniref:DUF6522 family protein n=1 Tax=Marivita sp. GX14005 TaxID=2942276 RepID=UPI002018C4F5|nr:DUF6522 family protein [Marivita sp. GX14005]MCL3881078.1 DUF6522 family protein [Marivita sp. GX14005]
MADVEFGEDGYVVDAGLIAKAFKLDPAEVQPLMQSGAITSRSETGMDEDAGRSRLTFFYRDRAFRLTLDAEHNILTRAVFDAPRPFSFGLEG